MPVRKISSPMRMRMTPPKILALPASLVPNFLPMNTPAKHRRKVTQPMMRHSVSAIKKVKSAMVKPTDRASREVAMPGGKSAAMPTAVFSVLPLVADALEKHLPADEGEQDERDPGNGGAERLEG